MDPIIGAAVAGGGQLLGALNNAAAARKKNSILTKGTREQSRAGMEATRTTGDFLSQLRGSAPNPAAERGAFTGALGAPSISAPMTGSAQFRNDAAGATAGARAYGGNLADLFSRIRAPQLQRQQEGQTIVGMGDALRPITNKAQDDDFLTNLRAGQVQANPWVGLLAGGLNQAGNYMMANGGSGSAAPTSPLMRRPGGYVVNTPGY